MALIRSRVIGGHVDAVLTRGYNGLLLIAPDDFSVGRKLAFSGEYNRRMIERISAWIHPDSRVLIVGTHVGAILVPLARLAREVVGIEANPRTFDLVTKNVVLNNLSNVRLLSLAASDKNGQLDFQLSRTNSGGSKIQSAEDRIGFSYYYPDVAQVRAARLDDILRGEAFDFVLMDIEGSEYFALQGMQDILAKGGKMVIEVLPINIEKIAGVTPETFFSAIPDSFEHVQFLTGESVRIIPRNQLLETVKRSWNDIYSSGCDLLFSKTPLN